MFNGKWVILVEDLIVCLMMMKVLVNWFYDFGGVKEIYVCVVCFFIIVFCFYGIDMLSIGEFFVLKFFNGSCVLIEEM